MRNIFRRNKQNEPAPKKPDVVVLKKTRPGECGGTDATLDRNAPKEIGSEDLLVFEAESALHVPYGPEAAKEKHLGFVSVFASTAGEGSFLFLETGEGFRGREERTDAWAFLPENVLPRLGRLVKELNLARNNGYHSTTHGLPENFGGSVYAKYADGTVLSCSNNQSPVLRSEEGTALADFFREAMKKDPVSLPDPDELSEIRFSEERENGGYTRAVLTLLPDGTGTNRKTSRYDGPQVYESEKPVDADTVSGIKDGIRRTGLFGWANLTDSGYASGRVKSLTFVFKDGTEITVPDGKRVPDRIRRGFFNIELEITTKH